MKNKQGELLLRGFFISVFLIVLIKQEEYLFLFEWKRANVQLHINQVPGIVWYINKNLCLAADIIRGCV